MFESMVWSSSLLELELEPDLELEIRNPILAIQQTFQTTNYLLPMICKAIITPMGLQNPALEFCASIKHQNPYQKNHRRLDMSITQVIIEIWEIHISKKILRLKSKEQKKIIAHISSCRLV